MRDTIINELICLVFSVLTIVISSILIPALAAWLKSKTENEKLQAVISDITTTVATSVNKYEQTAVAKLKEAGEWNAESQRSVLESALDEVITNLLDTTKDTLKENYLDVSEVIERHIESYIQSNK